MTEFNTDMFYIGPALLPMDSWLARKGVKGIRQQVTPIADIIAIVHIRRGPLGWFARRWIAKHPLELTSSVYEPEWGEWREVIGKVRVL